MKANVFSESVLTVFLWVGQPLVGGFPWAFLAAVSSFEVFHDQSSLWNKHIVFRRFWESMSSSRVKAVGDCRRERGVLSYTHRG